jgi:hypothetical protein
VNSVETKGLACNGSRSSLVVYDMIALSTMSVIAKVIIGVEKQNKSASLI